MDTGAIEAEPDHFPVLGSLARGLQRNPERPSRCSGLWLRPFPPLAKFPLCIDGMVREMNREQEH